MPVRGIFFKLVVGFLSIILCIFFLSPWRADRLFRKAYSAGYHDRWDLSADFLEKAVFIFPHQYPYYEALGTSYLELAKISGNIDEKKMFLLKAETNYEKYLKQVPQSALVLNAIGVTYLIAGRDVDRRAIPFAVEKFTKALELDKNFIEAYSNLASCYQLSGDRKKAVETIDKGLSINARVPILYYNLGVFFAMDGEDDKAIEYFRKCLEIDPNYGPAQEKIKLLWDSKN